jgi:hypothetical protein
VRLPRQSSKIVDSLAPVLQRCELTWTANEPKSVVTGSVKRAEVAAYADCTQSQMMAMFGWTDPKMPARYIAQADREKLGFSGMDKVVAFDQSADFAANETGTTTLNGVVTFPGNIRKKGQGFQS